MSDDRHGPPGPTDEEALFDAIRFGNDDEVRSAVEELVRRYGSRLLDSLRRWGLTRAECDDVASTTWLRAWQKIRRFEYRADGKFFAWLKVISRNVTLETFRARSISPPADEDELASDATLDDPADGIILLLRRDFRTAVDAALRDAPSDYRTLITAHFFDETALQEIQQEHGWTRSKLDVTKFRALAWLRKRLIDEYGERFVQDWLA